MEGGKHRLNRAWTCRHQAYLVCSSPSRGDKESSSEVGPTFDIASDYVSNITALFIGRKDALFFFYIYSIFLRFHFSYLELRISLAVVALFFNREKGQLLQRLDSIFLT